MCKIHEICISQICTSQIHIPLTPRVKHLDDFSISPFIDQYLARALPHPVRDGPLIEPNHSLTPHLSYIWPILTLATFESCLANDDPLDHIAIALVGNLFV